MLTDNYPKKNIFFELKKFKNKVYTFMLGQRSSIASAIICTEPAFTISESLDLQDGSEAVNVIF